MVQKSERVQHSWEMKSSIDSTTSYSLKQNSHKIFSISSHFCLQITLTCDADSRCGQDRIELTVVSVWLQNI